MERRPRNRKFVVGDRYKWNGRMVEYHSQVRILLREENLTEKGQLFHAPPEQAPETIGEPIQKQQETET